MLRKIKILATVIYQEFWEWNINFSKLKNEFLKYEDYLERFPDVDGFNYFYDKLSNGKFSLLDVRNLIKQSPEYNSVNHPLN